MIKFSKIEKGDIFTRDFRPLVKNNEISFSAAESMAVIYGPNVTGKTSFIKALSGDQKAKIEFEYDGQSFSSGENIFHIINDQNSRNIIAGEAKDFLLGDNIRKEFELQENINKERLRLISAIISMLKNNHGISSASNPLICLIASIDTQNLIKDLANNKSKGNKYSVEELIYALKLITKQELSEIEIAKVSFFKDDYASKESLIGQIEGLKDQGLPKNPKIREVEENTEAINILNKFLKTKCIVCDTADIDREMLLKRKTENRESVLNSFDEQLKVFIERIINITPSDDPCQIKEHLLQSMNLGDVNIIHSLIDEFAALKIFVSCSIVNDIVELFEESNLVALYTEYKKMIEEKPEITDEDLLYIEEIISNSMNKTLALDRDEQKNLKIRLANQDFLGKSRDELPLSTGEQNFLSLTFEFLKAKNSDKPIVVVDDPISSFDSIYKNKVVYAIIKILHNKKRIILTHNIDLLRLFDSQYSHCYNMYILNNTDEEENGFIPLNSKEQDMLINLKKLLDTFRSGIFSHIRNVELFLISMIPFMRGYANIINKSIIYEDLTKLMHGYNTESVDVSAIYRDLFDTNDSAIPKSYTISVSDVLSKTVDGVHIVDHNKYPLLDKTLRHSFTYLFLRLMVEKHLVAKFSIDTNRHKQLGQIISQAFPDDGDIAQIRNRIRLTSKKTLINEFNHFEGNLSIFQPAIDITDQALGKERTDVSSFVNTL